MKLIITILHIIIFTSSALAAVLHVDEKKREVIFLPTPDLELNLVNMGRDGGLLSLFLSYESQAIKNETQDLMARYPGFEVQFVRLEATQAKTILVIAEANFNRELTVRQGQSGPYVNANFELSRSEVEKIKAVKQIENKIMVQLEGKVNYRSDELIEEYAVESDYCRNLKFATVGDLVSQFALIKRPPAIRYVPTFESLKLSILKECFELPQNTVQNFADLLALPLKLNSQSKRIVGSFVQNREIEKTQQLKPNIKLQVTDLGL